MIRRTGKKKKKKKNSIMVKFMREETMDNINVMFFSFA